MKTVETLSDPSSISETSIDPGVRVGHVHLKVSDLERSISFYKTVLGFDLTQRREKAAFMSAGGYHHHLGLNVWDSEGGNRPAPGTTGLYHAAFLYPDRRALAVAYKRLIDCGIDLDGAADHGVSEALYLHDPDGNGLELYYDREPNDWPRDADGNLSMVNDRIDLRSLLAELEER